MEVIKIDNKQINHIFKLEEDHFNDVKSKRIAPAKLQETFVAFANSDGGDLYIGVEDKEFVGERIVGFLNQEEANGVLSTLLEETQPAVENVLVEFMEVSGKGLILHLGIPKSPKVHYTASGDCYIRINAGKRKIKGERITQLGYSKGAEPYEKKPIDTIEIEDILQSDYLKTYLELIETSLEPEKFLRKQRFNKEG
jgi:ATP-dependent DNA helicase RecG